MVVKELSSVRASGVTSRNVTALVDSFQVKYSLRSQKISAEMEMTSMFQIVLEGA